MNVDDLGFDGGDFVFGGLEFDVILVGVVLFEALDLLFVHVDLVVCVL